MSTTPKHNNSYSPPVKTMMASATGTNAGVAGNTSKNNDRAQQKTRCRFDMFVILRNDVPMTFATGAKEWCIRGDKYDKESPAKMLRYLLGIVKNHRTNYYLMELYDNTKPKEHGERLILKMLNNQVKVNRLLNYPELIKNFSLPEWLSYEVTD